MLTAADPTICDANPGAILPGIDTITGNPYAASSLLDVTKITQNHGGTLLLFPVRKYSVYVNQARSCA